MSAFDYMPYNGDALYDDIWNNENGYDLGENGGYASPPKPVTCKRCGKTGLYWVEVCGNWRLRENGELHICKINFSTANSKYEGKIMAEIKLTVRLSMFKNGLFNAQDYKGDGNFAYSAKGLIQKADEAQLKKINEAELQAITDKVGDKQKAFGIWKALKAKDKLAHHDGDIQTDSNFADHWVISMRRKKDEGQPYMVDIDGRTKVTADMGRIYSGCYCNVIVDVWYDDKWETGCNMKIKGVQFLRHGDAFGGSSISRDGDFEDLSSEQEAGGFDLGGDDEINFN